MVVSQTLVFSQVYYLMMLGKQSIFVKNFKSVYVCVCVCVFNETVNLMDLQYPPVTDLCRMLI